MCKSLYMLLIAFALAGALAGCGSNTSGPNPVPGGPDFNHPNAAAATIRKQIAGIQASSEPENFKRQQITQLQGLLNHAKPAADSAGVPGR